MGKGWAKNNYCDIIPDKIAGVCLKNCCYNHDLMYMNKCFTRKEADNLFKICIIWEFTKKKKRFLGFILANIFYFFVRLGGWVVWNKEDPK